MKKRKVCVVVTARPSYSRIKSALRAMRDHPDLDLKIILAASALLDRYGDMSSVLQSDGFEPAARVYMIVEGEKPVTSAKSTGLGLMELATALDNLGPDVVVTVADRHETLATAVAASYMNIPLAHVQGGEVTGSIDEKVRHAVTKLSDLHFVATQKSRERVLRMGEDPATVHLTGCPSIDLAAELARSAETRLDPFEKYLGTGPRLDLGASYVVVLQHPVTSEHALAREQIQETLSAVAQSGVPALWFWPNVDAGSDGTSKGIRMFRERNPAARMHFFKNLHPEDFLRLLLHCSCVVGNSSVAIREGSFLGVPAVNIGTRQKGRERGRNVVDVGYDEKEILAALKSQLARGKFPAERIYGDGRAGARIADALATLPLKSEKRLSY